MNNDPGIIAWLLILAYRTGEYGAGGISADVVEIGSPEGNTPLCLQKDVYKIVVLGRDYRVADTFDIRLE